MKYAAFCLVCLAGLVFLWTVKVYEWCGGNFFREMDYVDGFQSSRLAEPANG